MSFSTPDALQNVAQGPGFMRKDPLQQMIDEYQAMYDEAKEANLARYEEVVTGYEEAFDRQMGRLEDYGAQARADLGARFNDLGTNIQQDMVSRGLTGTTIMPTMQAGLERERASAMNRLDTSLNQQIGDADLGITSALLGFKERREDPYPDMNMMAGLASQMAEAEANKPTTLDWINSIGQFF